MQFLQNGANAFPDSTLRLASVVVNNHYVATHAIHHSRQPYRISAYVVTNDLAQDSTQATQEAWGFRWKIEQLHREGKQLLLDDYLIEQLKNPSLRIALA